MMPLAVQPSNSLLTTRAARGIQAAGAEHSRGQIRDVLVVEDDKDVRGMIRQVLQDEGYRVAAAADGQEALDLLQRGHYRLLLLDLMLPGLDGMAVLHALRVEPALRPPAVLILSALRERAEMLAALGAGADDYITKPFDIEDLGLRVDLWLRRTSPAAPLGPPGLRVHSLGRFYVERGGQIRLHADTRPLKARSLFTYLLSREGRPAPRPEVLALLWPDTPEDLQATSLRTLLYQLRRLLGLPDAAPVRVQASPTRVALQLGAGDWWDVAEFRAWLSEGARWSQAGDQDRALDTYAAGVALYGGDFLAEFTDAAETTWTRGLRAELRAAWLDALGILAWLHGQRGEHAEQEALLRRVLQADPYREPERRALMELLAGQGRPAEALLLYRDWETVLQTTLGTTPAPETRALAARIAAAASP